MKYLLLCLIPLITTTTQAGPTWEEIDALNAEVSGIEVLITANIIPSGCVSQRFNTGRKYFLS